MQIVYLLLLAACSVCRSVLFHACNTIMNLAGQYLSHDIHSLSLNQQKDYHFDLLNTDE